MPKVDVIVPAFNAAHYLPGALASVIAQTFDDWRILLVDDGSTDNTQEVVAPFVELLGPKLVYIRQANTGLPGARNTAIRHSSAEYLALLDADDIWLPCRLAESVRSLEARPAAGLSYGVVTLIDAQGNEVMRFAGDHDHAEGRIAPYIYKRMVELPCPTIAFRRKCVDEVGMFDETMRATEDRDLWLRIALRYEVTYVHKLIALYRISPGSMSGDPDRMMQAQLQFIRKHFGSPGCGIYERQVALARVYKQRAEVLSQRSRPWGALASALRAVALYPFGGGVLRTAGSLLLRAAGSTITAKQPARS